jgi:hypothetical protein
MFDGAVVGYRHCAERGHSEAKARAGFTLKIAMPLIFHMILFWLFFFFVLMSTEKFLC